MLSDLFRKKRKYVTISRDKELKPPITDDAIYEPLEETIEQKSDIQDGLWIKCPDCDEVMYQKELDNNQKICPKCNYHFRLSSIERLAITVDDDSFIELDENMVSLNPLSFPDYEAKLEKARNKSGLKEGVITGEATINGFPIIIAVLDFNFMGGSMGSVVGEKITRAIETSIDKQLPLIIISTSGGARMQEGILSLMQMAKTSAALAKLDQAGLLYISVLTDPTTGGVTASFASLGDIIIAEPKALIGFAGQRVIEQTIRQKLPSGFQRSEFMLEHGMIDLIIDRKNMKDTIANILKMHSRKEEI